MAGYYLYTLDYHAFTQLTTAPTKAQGLILADYLTEYLQESDEEFSDLWPTEREELADFIMKRLTRPDWYSDLSYDDAVMWDNLIHSFSGEPGEKLGLDFQCSDYESIYWDCAEIAAKKGATMMAEPAFGNSAFRYFGKPTNRYTVYPMYSVFTPDKVQKLATQLDAVEPHFRSLRDESEGSPKEQFFEGLLPAVRYARDNNRVLWVQTDT